MLDRSGHIAGDGPTSVGTHPGEISTPWSASDVAMLLCFGILSAVVTLVFDFKLRLPGHAILREAVPTLLALSLVRRSHAGTWLGAVTAVAGSVILVLNGEYRNPAALVGASLLAPLVERLSCNSSRGWRLASRVIVAGIVANLGAFAVRLGVAQLGIDLGQNNGAMRNWLFSLASFVGTGAVAGLIAGAGYLFRRSSSASSESA